MQSIIQKLIEAGVESPRLEARMIVENTQDKSAIEEIINKRKSGWPLDKILRKKGFYKSTFITNEDVLSPRPDTELLVEKAIVLAQELKNPQIIDLGTGSGCIIISVIKELQGASGVALDISEKALETAQKNASDLPIIFLQKNWFKDDIEGEFDIIVSNPPYIPSKDIATLDKEVRDHDPMLALDGGDDGLDSYRKIAELTNRILKPNGYILLEAGINQAQDIANIFANQGLTLIEITNDLASIPRVVVLQKIVCK